MSLATITACGSGGTDNGSFGNDTVPPQAGTVADGLNGNDVDTQTSTSEVHAHWSGFSDDSGIIAGYEWAVGTTAGATDVQAWTAVGTATTATATGLSLQVGQTLYASVRASDPSGNVSVAASSDGVTVTSSGSGGGGGSGATLAASLSQYGITWSFDQAYPTGQFANGDWWVVGPIDIVAISPGTQTIGGRVVHGSMINPGLAHIPQGLQGYDSELYGIHGAGTYQPSLNVGLGVSTQFPLTVAPGSSLISSISWTSSSAPQNGSQANMKTCAVLTVLAVEPPADAFRPPYSGTDKSIRFRESDLDYGRLALLQPTPNAPDLEATAARFVRPWLDHRSTWSARYMHPIDNMPDYGRDFTSLYGTGVLLANTDHTPAEKRNLVVNLVQIGIDFWANVQNGGVWNGTGGQCSGRKFPILFAGRLLGDAQMLALGTSHPSGYFGPNHPNNSEHFGEDCQTFYVTETSPGVWNWGYGNYSSQHDQLPEWGNNHTLFPQNDNSDWNADNYRRCCTANAWVGQTLAARVMGLVQAWNHPAYFDYVDRYMAIESVGSWTRSWDAWQATMWDTYRPAL